MIKILPLDWRHRVSELRDGNLHQQIVATEAECRDVATALGLLACHSIRVTYTIDHCPRGRFRVTGVLDAEVQQACVVSLEPVSDRLSVALDVEFWPPEQIQADDEIDVVVESDDDNDIADDPEPIDDGAIGIGRIVYELIATNLDPYPRVDGVELEKSRTGNEDEGRDGPFARLAAIRGGDSDD